LKAVVSTLPFSANFTLPNYLFEQQNIEKKIEKSNIESNINNNFENFDDKKPIVLDVVYKPVRTALIQQVFY
jgi:shikimate 5-dehydrogenase